VETIEDGPVIRIATAGGPTVSCRAAAVATNTPINDRVAIHTKMAPYRSYVIAGRMPRGSVADRLIWDTGSPYHYVRLQPLGDDDVLIVGGEDHKSGQASDMAERFERLEQWTRTRFPSLQAVEWRWSGQVMETVDDLGYLGRNPGNDRICIITGDSGMGMTHTAIGARIAADLIGGRANPWFRLFDPGRISLMAAGTYARENLNVAAQMAEHVLPGEVDSAAEIVPGEGAILRRGLHKVAAYRTPEGVLIERSAVCPHVGCVVAWNKLEGCWDCPCHGSQFAADGRVINGPATSNLGELRDEHVRPDSPIARRPQGPAV
jgi:Rieske Fe-S protein